MDRPLTRPRAKGVVRQTADRHHVSARRFVLGKGVPRATRLYADLSAISFRRSAIIDMSSQGVLERFLEQFQPIIRIIPIYH